MVRKPKPQSPNPVVRDAHGRIAGGGSLNPGGMTASQVALRRRVHELLDAAFTNPDGTDELVEIVVSGARQLDSTCLKLAFEYRYGKAPKTVNVNVNDTKSIDRSTLIARAREAMQRLEHEASQDNEVH